MDYSRSGSGGGGSNSSGFSSSGGAKSDSRLDANFKNDWECSKCGCDNFRRRLRCFKCGISKEDSEKAKPPEKEGIRSLLRSTVPSCTLALRGLDGLTAESGVMKALVNVCSAHIRNILIVRNEITGIGQGYGYVEFFSKQEAEEVMKKINLMDCPLEIDGKGIFVDFSKESFASVMTSLNPSISNSDKDLGYNYNGARRNQYNSYHDETKQTTSAVTHHGASQYMTTTQSTNKTREYTSLSDAASSASDSSRAGVSNSSVGSLQASDEFANYASPDLNRYVFDDTTGYYIDPVTGLYYDAGTQYFYHMETSKFLYWDPEKNCYFPAAVKDQETDGSEVSPSSEATSKQEEEKKKRAKEAKKIAKDMEKWAKEQNSHKDSGFKKPLAPIGLPLKAKQSGAADAGFSVLTKNVTSNASSNFQSKFTIELSKQKEEKKVLAAPALPGLVEYGGDSDSETEGDDEEDVSSEDAEKAIEEKLIDWDKRTCLLCRRAFSSLEILQKHRQLSDLHKNNLEDYKKKLRGTVTRAAITGITKATTAAK